MFQDICSDKEPPSGAARTPGGTTCSPRDPMSTALLADLFLPDLTLSLHEHLAVSGREAGPGAAPSAGARADRWAPSPGRCMKDRNRKCQGDVFFFHSMRKASQSWFRIIIKSLCHHLKTCFLLINNRNVFPMVLELGNPRRGCPRGRVRAALRWQVLTVPSGGKSVTFSEFNERL